MVCGGVDSTCEYGNAARAGDDAATQMPLPPETVVELVSTITKIQQRLMQLESGGTVAGIHGAAPQHGKMRMVERKAFQKLESFSGAQAQFETWAFKVRGFLHTEAGFRPLLDWIEKVAMVEEDDHGQRPLTLMGRRTPQPGGDPLHSSPEGNHFEDTIPEALGKLVLYPDGPPITKWSELEWLGENLFEVSQSLLGGAHMTQMLKNLDLVQPAPARGCEAWCKLVRQTKGNTGPRLMHLVAEIFAPTRGKNLEQLGAAVDTWEGHVQDFELSG